MFEKTEQVVPFILYFYRFRKIILEACKSGVRLLVFPKCAVTGYPPHCIEHSSDVDFEKVSQIHEKLQILSEESKMYIVIGTIIKDDERFNMIKGHIQTRAVENVCPIMTCNTCSAFQTAPTVLFDRSGKISVEMPGGKEGLMFYDFDRKDLDFGEQGRKIFSDSLIR